MRLKTIGLLGGMGPQATIQVQQLVLEAVSADDDCDHIPLLVDMNPQVPSRIDFLIHKRGPSPGPTLATMAQRLEKAGAEALAMPCNTAHYFASDIERSVSIPFLNMVTLTAYAFESKGYQRIGMLASPAVQDSALFEQAFKARNIVSIWPQDMANMLAIIQGIKAQGPTEALFARLQAHAQSLLARGADALLIGCSEYSLFANRWSHPVEDSLAILAREIVRYSSYGRME